MTDHVFKTTADGMLTIAVWFLTFTLNYGEHLVLSAMTFALLAYRIAVARREWRKGK